MRAERATVRHDLDFSGSARLEPETRARTHCIIVNTAPGGGRLSNNSYLLSAKDKHKAETKRLVSTVTTRLHVQQGLPCSYNMYEHEWTVGAIISGLGRNLDA
jgi:hypothetical protein